jgi:Holliday junction resolvasome RuvABC ATP-dependent DNA helicase subunit
VHLLPLASEVDHRLDYSIRPHQLAVFVGQERIKKVLGDVDRRGASTQIGKQHRQVAPTR